MSQWPVGTVVVARCVIIDGTKEEMFITAKPGDLGIVFMDCGNGVEVQFENGCFTSGVNDPSIALYIGAVSTVCDGQPCHPDQAALFARMK